MKRFSLKRRSTIMILGLIFSLIITLGLFYVIDLRDAIYSGRHNTLRMIVAGIENALNSSNDIQRLKHDIDLIIYAYPSPQELIFRIWHDDSNTDLLVSEGLEATRWEHFHTSIAGEPPPIGSDKIFVNALDGVAEDFDVIWSRRQTTQGVVNILVAHSDKGARAKTGWMLLRFVVLLAFIILASVVASILLIRVALAPIRDIARKCEAIDQGNITSLDLKNIRVPIELDPFVRALNGMLARLHAAMVRQRQFTADASHELRTPLATAKSSLQLAVSRERTAGEYNKTICDTLEDLARMERLSNQLLDLARLDTAVDRSHFEPVELGEVVADAIQAVEAKPETAGCKIKHQDLSRFMVHGIRDQLSRLFQNIIDNAVKYGPEGEPVEVTIERNVGNVIVRVKDKGGNIPPDLLPKLFDRFFRIDPSRSRSSGGSGLGLAIAREIAELHGGSLDIVSSPEEGTIVSFSMPSLPAHSKT